MSDFGPLVSPEWLHMHTMDADLRVIDFRWYLSGRSGRASYDGGHIPGAVFVDLEAVTGTEGGGRHPLPNGKQFEEAMRQAGVDADSRVVAYDDSGGSVAARLWFLLRWFGHGAQAVLDGGIQAWGEPLETVSPPSVSQGNFTAHEPDRSRVVDFAQVALLGDATVIDARAGERYRGEKEPIDPKAGHIPGALSAPFAGNLAVDGRFKSPHELRQRFAAAGYRGGKAVVYCGSGVNACHNLLALELAGAADVLLYAGSWSDWSNRDLPVATGPEP